MAFEDAWKRSPSSIELSRPIIGDDGIEYTAELYDPFSGISRGRYSFEWLEIADVIRNPGDVGAIHETVSEWIIDEVDSFDSGELAIDEDGRVHFRSDLMDE